MEKSDKDSQIISIGINEECSDELLHFFLPNFPKIKGNEYPLRINHFNVVKIYNTKDIANLVKGLHLLELKYREMTNHDFGFGSPSKSEPIIYQLEKRNKASLAKELRDWIAKNGGNYYIKAEKDTISSNKTNERDVIDLFYDEI